MSAHCNEDGREAGEGGCGNGEREEEDGEHGVELNNMHQQAGVAGRRAAEYKVKRRWARERRAGRKYEDWK